MRVTDSPTFSIVVPTYNRPEQLAACLHACTLLDYPSDRFEVIAVDDGGTSPLDHVFARFSGTLPLRLLRQENSGPAAARNRGALAAKGRFLAFTDDDCAPTSDWLRALEAEFDVSPGSAVGGRTINRLSQNVYSTASQVLISYLCAYYNSTPKKARFCPSSNLAFPAEHFRAIGGFDVTYPRAAAEDRDICERWLYSGSALTYAPDAVVVHSHELSLRTFLCQHFRYGQGAFYFHRVRSQRRQMRMRVEPISFYLKMLCYPFACGQGRRAPLVALLLLIAQIANGLGFFWNFTTGKMK